MTEWQYFESHISIEFIWLLQRHNLSYYTQVMFLLILYTNKTKQNKQPLWVIALQPIRDSRLHIAEQKETAVKPFFTSNTLCYLCSQKINGNWFLNYVYNQFIIFQLCGYVMIYLICSYHNYLYII